VIMGSCKCYWEVAKVLLEVESSFRKLEVLLQDAGSGNVVSFARAMHCRRVSRVQNVTLWTAVEIE
jgi:hypothetical protein